MTFQNQEEPGLDDFIGLFFQTFEKEIIPILYNLFQKIAEGILPNSFYAARHYPNTPPDKVITRNDNYKPHISHEIDAKILNKILAKRIQQ